MSAESPPPGNLARFAPTLPPFRRWWASYAFRIRLPGARRIGTRRAFGRSVDLRPAVIAATLSALLGIASPAAGGLLDSLVARVDDTVITWSEGIQEAEILKLAGGLAASTGASPVEAIVRRKLLAQEAQKLRLDASAAEITAEIAAETRTGQSAAEFRERAGALGVSEAALRARGREVVMARKYLELRHDAIYVTESEVRSYLSGQPGGTADGSSTEARNEARAVLAKTKFEREVDTWIRRQYSEGRVRLLEQGVSREQSSAERP